MFNSLFPVFYLRISPQQISIRNVRTGDSFTDTPDVAIQQGAQKTILAVGAATGQARLQPDVEVHNPFAHPRSLLSDFTLGLQLVKLVFKKILLRQPWRHLLPAPRVLLHLQGMDEGGYTQVEIRGMREMILGAGASDVILWQGAELSDAQILSRNYPPGGEVLE